ncbi:MAG TPA: M56 family metallopeptidase [Sphingomicrobium sp.]|nr:M56 family metallopeptidase [Sphingomicrobium sp.]
MEWFIPLAAKSFFIAGGALLLLKILANRSAADRSWIAHLALAGLLLLPVATVALPTLDVAGPELLVGKGEVLSPSSPAPAAAPQPIAASAETSAPLAEPGVGSASINWPFWSYAVPAALLFLLTLIAIARLFVLKARAAVLVDAPWLTALARAQHRMGFKHGTALLTSTELPSPISWGLFRPVILLNAEAARSHEEAEAIITHELAHVARLDWAKLLLARVTVALFWFNPFVWLLAREAHQLREEAADDAVLAADIEDTDYARLLVGVARHECRGLLIGAHGVAPAKNSLARRVRRVLDGAVKRAPGGWRWGSAVAFFAAGMSVPVAALNLVPAAAAPSTASAGQAADSPYYESIDRVAEDSAKDGSKTAAVASGIFDIADDGTVTLLSKDGKVLKIGKGSETLLARNGATITSDKFERTVLALPDGKTITSTKDGRSVVRSPDGQVIAFADARAVPGLASAIAHPHDPVRPSKRTAIDRAISMKAVGVTPEYLAAIRSAAPQLSVDPDDLVELKAVGVTPEFIRELTRLGYRATDAGDLAGAYAVGVRADYIRSLAKAGLGRLSLEDLTELKAVGVTAADVERYRRAGLGKLDVDRLTELKALGVTPEELKANEDFGP